MRSALSSQLVRTFLVCLAVRLLLPMAERPTATAEAAAPSPRVTVARPIAKTIDVWDEYTGRFEALKQVEVRARVSGTLDKINFADGQLVKEGDLLFIIDPRPYQIAVDSAKADVTKAQAQVTLAATDANRALQLAESRTITSREVDQRKANLEVAKAQQLAAEAALRNAELNLEWTQVRAPIPGRVSDRRVDAGNLIQGGQTGATLLTTIVTLDPIHFVFDASEADYLRYARLSAQGQRPSSRDVKNPVTGPPCRRDRMETCGRYGLRRQSAQRPLRHYSRPRYFRQQRSVSFARHIWTFALVRRHRSCTFDPGFGDRIGSGEQGCLHGDPGKQNCGKAGAARPNP